MTVAPALLAGLAFGLSLIVAIGAQNAFVLRQGLRREHVLIVVASCVVADVALITAGVAGLGSLIVAIPWLLGAIRVIGALFLTGYAALALRRALRPTGLDPADGGAASASAVFATAMALTWLNPHVYLDTVVLLGSISATHGDDRWWFGVGAAVGSAIWFTALGFGARLLRPLFAKPIAWRILDGTIAVVMLSIAVSLVLPLLA